MNLPKFYTRWRVIDENDKILFEGYFGEAEKFIKDNKLEKARLDPKMYEHEEEKK